MAGVSHVRMTWPSKLTRPTGGNLTRGIRKPARDGMAYTGRESGATAVGFLYSKSSTASIVSG